MEEGAGKLGHHHHPFLGYLVGLQVFCLWMPNSGVGGRFWDCVDENLCWL